MGHAPRVVVLFDLDLTLLRNPVDREVIAAALDEATGVPGLLDGIDYAGRSDRWLVGEVSRSRRIDPAALFTPYASAYTRLLEQALAPLPPSALPGALELLATLQAEASTTLGVATGNLRANALIKMAHARLTPFFDPLRGGFGDHLDDRADIVRAAALACGYHNGGRLVVVGDTVHDVRAARSLGAVAVGVATGHATPSALSAAGAHVVAPDMTDAGLVEAILG